MPSDAGPGPGPALSPAPALGPAHNPTLPLHGQQPHHDSSSTPLLSPPEQPAGVTRALVSAKTGTASGQKRAASGQLLLDSAHASKHSRQTTLHTGFQGAHTWSGQVDRSAAGLSAGSNGRTPAGSGPAPLQWSNSRQTPSGQIAAQHAEPHRAGESPHVAQVLDLTQSDEEPSSDTKSSPHLQPSARLSTGGISASRHRAPLHPYSSSSPKKIANVLDVT